MYGSPAFSHITQVSESESLSGGVSQSNSNGHDESMYIVRYQEEDWHLISNTTGKCLKFQQSDISEVKPFKILMQKLKVLEEKNQ